MQSSGLNLGDAELGSSGFGGIEGPLKTAEAR